VAKVKLVNCPEQGIQPATDSEAVLVRFDIDYLIKCLGFVRSTSYSIVEQPDVMERSRPQPDYLLKDEQGNMVAIEHARFFESQESREHEAVAVKKEGGYMGFINFSSPQELGKRLSDFFDDKIDKGQFAEFGHCERILLARNRWDGISTEGFLKCEPHFKALRQKDCDYFYLIIQGHLVEVF
jgi:hypothetical protein